MTFEEIIQKYKACKDKGGNKYIEHLDSVKNKALNIYLKNHNAVKYIENIKILDSVSFYHDILEDTECTYKLLKENTNERIANCVRCLTRLSSETYNDYINRICNFEDNLVMYVKLADLEDNLDVTRYNRELNLNDLSLINRYIKARNKILNKL